MTAVLWVGAGSNLVLALLNAGHIFAGNAINFWSMFCAVFNGAVTIACVAWAVHHAIASSTFKDRKQ